MPLYAASSINGSKQATPLGVNNAISSMHAQENSGRG
jgi:hypothetical protein